MLPFAHARLNWKQLASPAIGVTELTVTPIVTFWIVFSWIVSYRLGLSVPTVALACVGASVVIRLALPVLYLAPRPRISKWQKLVSLVVGTPAAVLLNM